MVLGRLRLVGGISGRAYRRAFDSGSIVGLTGNLVAQPQRSSRGAPFHGGFKRDPGRVRRFRGNELPSPRATITGSVRMAWCSGGFWRGVGQTLRYARGRSSDADLDRRDIALRRGDLAICGDNTWRPPDGRNGGAGTVLPPGAVAELVGLCRGTAQDSCARGCWRRDRRRPFLIMPISRPPHHRAWRTHSRPMTWDYAMLLDMNSQELTYLARHTREEDDIRVRGTSLRMAESDPRGTGGAYRAHPGLPTTEISLPCQTGGLSRSSTPRKTPLPRWACRRGPAGGGATLADATVEFARCMWSRRLQSRIGRSPRDLSGLAERLEGQGNPRHRHPLPPERPGAGGR